MDIDTFAEVVIEAANQSSLYDMEDESYVQFQIHAAIYAYASMNHSGQGSDLYRILCCSEFNPGPMWTETEEMDSNEFYSLVEEIANRENIT